jgi:transcriptional regulator with XRE-family HTH domain
MLKKEKMIKAIADVLRKARVQNNYTIERLANESGTDYSTANLIENGKQNPQIYTIYKLLYPLGIDLVALLKGEAEEKDDRRTLLVARLETLDLATLESITALLGKFEVKEKK